MRTTVTVDDEVFARAAKALGTTGMPTAATMQAALARIAQDAINHEAARRFLDVPLEISDEAMQGAWRQ